MPEHRVLLRNKILTFDIIKIDTIFNDVSLVYICLLVCLRLWEAA